MFRNGLLNSAIHPGAHGPFAGEGSSFPRGGSRGDMAEEQPHGHCPLLSPPPLSPSSLSATRAAWMCGEIGPGLALV